MSRDEIIHYSHANVMLLWCYKPEWSFQQPAAEASKTRNYSREIAPLFSSSFLSSAFSRFPLIVTACYFRSHFSGSAARQIVHQLSPCAKASWPWLSSPTVIFSAQKQP
jgi:hypothetical protein